MYTTTDDKLRDAGDDEPARMQQLCRLLVTSTCASLTHLSLKLGGLCARSDDLQLLLSKLANGSTDLLLGCSEPLQQCGILKQLKVTSPSEFKAILHVMTLLCGSKAS